MSGDGVDVPKNRQLALDTFSLLSGKWQPTVLAVVAHHEPIGFNDLLGRIPDVSGKVLSETLGALDDAGLVRRHVVNESPLRVEYERTEAAREMDAVFDALSGWGRKHLEDAAPTVLIADADRRITAMYGEWMSGRYTVVRVHNAVKLANGLEMEPAVVILDEELPGAGLRQVPHIVGSKPRTIALIGDQPTVDLVDVNCDDVLRKPVVRSTLLDAVDVQLARRGETTARREAAAMAAKLSFLEAVHPDERLAADDAYVDAHDRLVALEETIASGD